MEKGREEANGYKIPRENLEKEVLSPSRQKEEQ